MIDDCLSEFDFSDGIDYLEYTICEKIGLVTKTPEDVREYIEKNKKYLSDYPELIKAKIKKAFDIIENFDAKELENLREIMNSSSNDSTEAEFVKESIFGSPGEVLKISDHLDNQEVGIINDCLGDATTDDLDLHELAYDILEALVNRHKSKAEILSHKQDYESIIGLYRQPVIEAFKDAMHKVDILSEDQVEEIRRIIES